MTTRASRHGMVPIDADILARYEAALPRVVASRSAAWHRAWLTKLLVRLAVCAYLLYGMHRLGWSPAILLGFLVVATWTAWACDLLAIFMRSRAWQGEVDADAEHAFVVQVLRNRDKPDAHIPSSVMSAGGANWGASALLGGIATACIALFWGLSQVSFVDAFRAEPVALATLVILFVSMVVGTLLAARSKARGTMAGLSTAGPMLRLVALWMLMFVCFVAAVNDLATMRVVMTALYSAAVVATLAGLAAMPSLAKETAALRSALSSNASRTPTAS